MSQPALIAAARARFHERLRRNVLAADAAGVPGNADKSSKTSVAIASRILEQLGPGPAQERLAGQSAGSRFEDFCQSFLSETFLALGGLRPGEWDIIRIGQRDKAGLTRFSQYQHIQEIANAVAGNPDLASILGSDYLITPDIVIGRRPVSDERINADGPVVDDSVAGHTPLRLRNNAAPLLHASISCKWTLRSDRAQNARSEALNLIRNRKGPLPHIAVITGEPTPSRIASLALGTGDIDCVYHFALPELARAVANLGYADAGEMLDIMIDGQRLRDLSDLPLDLAA